MRGKILDYRIQENRGIISGDNNTRYVFLSNEWKDNEVEPKVGQEVDFEIEGNQAKEIYLVKKQNTIISTFNGERSEIKKKAVLAAIGSGMGLFSIIPVIGILLLIIGFVLEGFGIKTLSDNAKKDKNIFKNYIFAIVFFLIGSIFLVFVMGAGFVMGAASTQAAGWTTFGLGILAYIVLGILAIIRFYKVFNSIGDEYNVPLMKIVAKAYVAGICLVPVFGIGILVLIVASIVKIFAYLKIEK